MLLIRPKKRRKLLCCPQVEFLNIWGSRLENIFFLITILKSTHKYQKWVHFPLFSQQKKKKKKKMNKHPILQKLGAFPTLTFISFLIF